MPRMLLPHRFIATLDLVTNHLLHTTYLPILGFSLYKRRPSPPYSII